ncbi:hypothetical protein [Bacteroides acidifaciens]|uniref:hypothetical protein n=1 Tax=Bacteroides acidifaciens TaxID=85831 RepID=UPI0030153F48
MKRGIEFEQQLERNLLQNINDFLTNIEYEDIKKLYKDNFEAIEILIEKFGVKLSIEDISHLNPTLSGKIFSNILLLKEINTAIQKGKLRKKDL